MSGNTNYTKLILYHGIAKGYAPGSDPNTKEGEREMFQFACRQLSIPENLSMNGYAMVPSEAEAAKIISHAQRRIPTEAFSTIKIFGVEGGQVHFRRQLDFIGWDDSRRTELVDLLTASGATFNLEPQGDITPLTFHSRTS